MYSTIAHVFANMSSVSDAKPELNMFNMQCLLSPSTPTIRTPASPLCSSAWGELGQLRFMPQFRVVEVEGLSESPTPYFHARPGLFKGTAAIFLLRQ